MEKPPQFISLLLLHKGSVYQCKASTALTAATAPTVAIVACCASYATWQTRLPPMSWPAHLKNQPQDSKHEQPLKSWLVPAVAASVRLAGSCRSCSCSCHTPTRQQPGHVLSIAVQQRLCWRQDHKRIAARKRTLTCPAPQFPDWCPLHYWWQTCGLRGAAAACPLLILWHPCASSCTLLTSFL